jgi:putative ABC transport system permease protein
VAFVAGTFIFTDTLSRTFEDLFGQTTSDVEITPKSAFDAQGSEDAVGASVPASLVPTVAGAPGVAKAGGSVLVNGVLVVGKDGKTLGTAGAPAFGVSWSDDAELSPFRLVPGSGKGPTKAGEVALDSQTAEAGGFVVGDTVRLVTPNEPLEAEVTGIFRFGTSGNLAGASLTAFDEATAQALLLAPGRFSAISAKADPGTTQDEAKASIIKAIGPEQAATLDIKTGQEAADDAAASISQALSFVNIFLLVFAGIALLVGSFIILNTFSMLVAQRARELALLRALGASRRQVTWAVLGEAFVVGLVGSLLGIGLGLVLALGLKGLISTLGGDLPTGALVIAPRTVIVAILVGVLVTLAAAYVPARRASKVPPVAAMRDDVVIPQRSLRLRVGLGLVLLVLGVLVLGAGLGGSGSEGASTVGLGALLLFFAVITLAPIIAGPVIRVLGWPVKARGISGRIAIDNARRNRRRTASTASALMIGLALVGAFAILGSSTTESTNAAIDEAIGADFIVTDASFTGFSPVVAENISEVDGIDVVSVVRTAPAEIDGSVTTLAAIDPATAPDVITVTMVEGELSDVADGLLVDSVTATNASVALGDSVEITFGNGTQQTQEVVGLYEGAGLLTGWVTSNQSLADAGIPPRDTFVYATVDADTDIATVRPAVDKAVADFPNVKVQDQGEYKEEIAGQINQLLTIIFALLALAVIISILGIVNTLALSVVERTREVGLLRAVGMSRGQLQVSIVWESVVIAVFGAVLGIGLGLIFGVSLQQVLREQGISVLSIPWALLAVFLVVAGLVGILAALWPAYRASRMDVLSAITTE